MRRLFFLIFILLLQTCSIDDGNTAVENSHFEILPVDNIDLPDTFVLGQTYQISMAYVLPTDCHLFNDIYYRTEGNTRTIAVVSEVVDSSNCSQTNTETITSFNFVPRTTGMITFKFWQGQDENEVDQYLEIVVPITE